MNRRLSLGHLKAVAALLSVAVLISNFVSVSHWSETRGVYDDICYLRQAHLFQRFGIGGLDTDISKDDDHYLQGQLKEIGYPAWSSPIRAPCHTMPDTKFVLQYPPGTGFLLALFPQGYQVAPLYAASSLIVFCFALLGVFYVRSPLWILSTVMFGVLALSVVVNPGKTSYSIAPTMAVCAVAGYLTSFWLLKANRSQLLVILIGLLLGLSVNLRLPNAILSAGYFLYLAISFLRSRQLTTLAQGTGFGVGFLVGTMPTLIANAINAGSPFTTTYGGVDVAPPEFKFGIFTQYAADLQFALIALSVASTIYMFRWKGQTKARQVGLIVGGNLLVNLAFFLSHPVFTQYYVIPIAMLSLWSLSFAHLMQEAEVAKVIPAA